MWERLLPWDAPSPAHLPPSVGDTLAALADLLPPGLPPNGIRSEMARSAALDAWLLRALAVGIVTAADVGEVTDALHGHTSADVLRDRWFYRPANAVEVALFN